MAPSSTCSNDNSFGPNVLGCRENFDFTIKLEQLIFSIIPSILFLVLRHGGLLYFSADLSKMISKLLISKLSSIVVYIGINLALLIFVLKSSLIETDLGIASYALHFVTGFFMLSLSFLDHMRSPRPSMLPSAYLLPTILLDIAQVRTVWLASFYPTSRASSAIFTSSVLVKAIILVLEAQRKTKWIKWDSKNHSPEETSGLYSLGVYSWLNSLFVNGYRSVLQMQDLFPLDKALSGHTIQSRLSSRLSHCKLLGNKYGLLNVLIRTFAVPLLLPIPARLALLGFTFCQPFFINSLLSHLSASEGSITVNVEYGFIGANFFIYNGIAISY